MFCKVFKDAGKFITAKPKINYVKNVKAEVIEVEVVEDYNSDDEDEVELLRQQEQIRLKLEKKKQKKIQEDKTQEWEDKKEHLFISAIQKDMNKLVEFAKKSNIPLTLLSMGIDLTENDAEIAYHSYEQEQMDSDYSQVKDNFFTQPRPTSRPRPKARKSNNGATDYIAPVRVTDGTRTPQNIMVPGEELHFKHKGEYFQFTYTGSNEFLYKGVSYRGLNNAVVCIQALENMGYKKNAWNVWDHVEIYRLGTWGSVKKLPLL